MNKYTVKRIVSDDELHTAASLVFGMFKKQGYVDSNDSLAFSSIITPMKNGSTSVFGIFAEEDNVLLGTISVFHGESLPLEEVFQEEISMVRKEGLVIAEIGRFAVDDKVLKDKGKHLGEKLSVSKNLMKAAFDEAIQKNVDILCVAINPKHDRFYDLLGFESISDTKPYSFGTRPLTIAKVLRVNAMQRGAI